MPLHILNRVWCVMTSNNVVKQEHDTGEMCGSGREAGVGVVQVLGYLVVVVSLLSFASFIVASGQAKHHARAAADLGALSAASSLYYGRAGEGACAVGEKVVRANKAVVTECVLEHGGRVRIAVEVKPRIALLPAIGEEAVAGSR